jgi:hypothetical protein
LGGEIESHEGKYYFAVKMLEGSSLHIGWMRNSKMTANNNLNQHSDNLLPFFFKNVFVQQREKKKSSTIVEKGITY